MSTRVFFTLIGALLLLSTNGVRASADGLPAAAWQQPARYRFEYRVDLPKLDAAKRVRVWIPHPAETRDQHVISADIDAPWQHKQTRDVLNNQFIYLEGSGVAEKPLIATYVVERRPSTGVVKADVKPGSSQDPNLYRHADQLVPLDGLIQQIAKQESAGLSTEPEKVRAFYNYVVKSMRYNKDGTGWGRGDAIWACTNKRGNCTDFHSLFIGMSRSQGIPARFHIGFPIPRDSASGAIAGYHCWAEYFDADRGWVPVDASEANKSGLTDAYFGTLPNDRIQFTTGRDLRLDPPQDGAPLNYFIYPYVEADGTVVKDVPASFRFERITETTAQR